jgi:hypothetical protein
MSVTVKAVGGSDDVAFIYLVGTHDQDSRIVRTRTVTRSAVAGGSLTIAGERDALVAEVEQAYSDYVASQAALEGL